MTLQLGDAEFSQTGVRISSDFRDNLIIDRYDPVFTDMRASKIKHLRSANSEDAVTWNVFRSLRQVAPSHWFPTLWSRAFAAKELPLDPSPTVRLWVSVPPPISLLVGGDEGASEIDVVLESGSWVWFIEAKYGSDISSGTTTRPGRDQILRNIDVGTYYAGVRQFYFTLLIMSDKKSREGKKRIEEYSDFSKVRTLLKQHRPDALANLTAVSAVTWSDLASVLAAAASSTLREDEREYAKRALSWLKTKEILPHDV